MRKIETKEELEKKKKKNQYLLGLVMVFLLTASTAGYSLMSRDGEDESKATERGIEFLRESGMWTTSVSGQKFYFQYLPSEVEYINQNVTMSLGGYANRPLYFVNSNQGISNIIQNMGMYTQRYQEACISEENCTNNLPVKDCSSNLIIFEPSSETKVYQIENCVYILGDSVRGSDAFLYKVLGIV